MQNPLFLISWTLDYDSQGPVHSSPGNPPGAHPNPPPAHPLSMQTGRIIPFKKHIILFHLHQYVSQSCVAAAWDCPSVLFSKASMARTILSRSLLNILLLLHVPVWECCCDTCYTVHGWKTKQNKAYLYIVEYSIYCSPIQQRWLDIEDISELSFHLSCCFCVVIEFDYY